MWKSHGFQQLFSGFASVSPHTGLHNQQKMRCVFELCRRRNLWLFFTDFGEKVGNFTNRGVFLPCLSPGVFKKFVAFAQNIGLYDFPGSGNNEDIT